MKHVQGDYGTVSIECACLPHTSRLIIIRCFLGGIFRHYSEEVSIKQAWKRKA